MLSTHIPEKITFHVGAVEGMMVTAPCFNSDMAAVSGSTHTKAYLQNVCSFSDRPLELRQSRGRPGARACTVHVCAVEFTAVMAPCVKGSAAAGSCSTFTGPCSATLLHVSSSMAPLSTSCWAANWLWSAARHSFSYWIVSELELARSVVILLLGAMLLRCTTQALLCVRAIFPDALQGIT